MGHGRPEPLTLDEAKAAIVEWGRHADRALGRRIASRPVTVLGAAFMAGLTLALVLPRSKPRRRGRR